MTLENYGGWERKSGKALTQQSMLKRNANHGANLGIRGACA
jgi:hypothetical protein